MSAGGGNLYRKPRRGGQASAGGTDDWLVTYADAMTLLLAFFIILVAISEVDPVKFQQMQQGMAKNIGKRDVTKPMTLMKIDMEKMVRNMELQDAVAVGSDSKGLTLEFASAALFGKASAQLKKAALPVMRKTAKTLESPRYEAFRMEVQGHTDNTPINTPRFPSNWELSALRATNVARTLEKQGIKRDRMRVIGFAGTAPKVPNKGPEGNPIPRNQAKNRRVVIRIMPR